jgi:hypothetical protein
MRLIFLALCAASGACTPAPVAVASTGPGEATPCALTVRFGSYAMGIDRGAAERVEALLRGDRSVRSVERRPWGREGEYDLCAQVAQTANALRLYEQIRPAAAGQTARSDLRAPRRWAQLPGPGGLIRKRPGPLGRAAGPFPLVWQRLTEWR